MHDWTAFVILSFFAHLPSGAETFFETNCQAVVCAGSIQRVHPKTCALFFSEAPERLWLGFPFHTPHEKFETALNSIRQCALSVAEHIILGNRSVLILTADHEPLHATWHATLRGVMEYNYTYMHHNHTTGGNVMLFIVVLTSNYIISCHLRGIRNYETIKTPNI